MVIAGIIIQLILGLISGLIAIESNGAVAKFNAWASGWAFMGAFALFMLILN